MMENFFFSLNSICETWMNPSSTTWAMDMILAFVCGLGLFLLVLPCLESNPSSPPAVEKKNLKKHQVKWGPNKKRKKTGNLKVTRDCIRKTEEIQNVVLILESRLEKLHDEEGLHELLHADTTSEVLRTGPTTEQWTPRQSVGNPFPNTFSPLPSQAPLTQGQLPLVSPLSVEHQEDQSDLKRIPLGTVPQSSGPGTSYLTSIIRNNSGLDPCNHPISILFWWWATAKALLFPSWAHAKNQECLSPLPPEATLGDPTHWQTEAGGLSFLEPNVQKHLESLITKRADLKLWEKTDKKGSFFQPTNPDYPLDSPGNLVKLKGNPQNTGSNSFWTRKGRPQALPSSQQHSYSIDLGNIVQEKCIQLFWGPPSLHSESLVATAWVHNRSSSAQPKAVAFNKVSNSLPVQHQAEGPPQLFCAEQLPQEVAQPQLWRQSMSPSVVQIQTCSSPSQPPSSSQIRSCIITSSRSQHKAQSLTPNEDQNLECPWQKQLKWKKVLASKFQNSQEAIRQPTLNHPTGSQDTHTTKSTPILPDYSDKTELQEHKEEKQSQDRVIRDEQQHCPPIRFLASQELKQPEDKFPEKYECQAKDKHGPFQPIKPSDLTGESSKGIQKVGSTYSGRSSKKSLVTFKLVDPSKVHRQDLRKNPEDLHWSTGSPSLKNLMEESEHCLLRPGKCHSGTHLSTNPNKEYLEKILQVHLSRKLELMKEGMIPLCVRKSWLATNHDFPKSNTHMKPIHKAPSEGQPSRVNTSQELSFLDPKSHQVLETGMIRYRVRHRWDPHLQVLESMNVNLSEAPASPFPQPAIPSSGDYVAKVANFLEELPQKVRKEKVIRKMSLATLQNQFPAHTPAELQKAETVTPSGGQCVLAEAHPHEQEDSLSLQFSSYNFKNRIQLSRTVLGTGIGSIEPGLSTAMYRHDLLEERANEASGDTGLNLTLLEIQSGSQPSVTKEIVQVEDKLSPASDVNMETSKMANSQIINLELKGSEVPGTSNISSPTRFSIWQNPVDTNLKAHVVKVFESQQEMELAKESQGMAPGIRSDCQVNVLPTTDSPHSQSSLSSSQCTSSSNVVTFQNPCDHFKKEVHRLVQQEPHLTRVKVTGKKNTKMLDDPDRREDCGRLTQGQLEESFAAVRSSQAGGLSPHAKVREIVATGSKSSPCLPQKGQAPPESPIKRKMKNILQYFNINTKGKGQEDSQPKHEHPSSSTQSRGSVTSRVLMDGGEAEARVLTKVVEQIIMDKLGLQLRSGPSELRWHKEKPQALLGRHYYYSNPRDPGPSRVMTNTCCCHQDTHKGHSHLMRNRWTTDQGRIEHAAQRPCVFTQYLPV